MSCYFIGKGFRRKKPVQNFTDLKFNFESGYDLWWRLSTYGGCGTMLRNLVKCIPKPCGNFWSNIVLDHVDSSLPGSSLRLECAIIKSMAEFVYTAVPLLVLLNSLDYHDYCHCGVAINLFSSSDYVTLQKHFFASFLGHFIYYVYAKWISVAFVSFTKSF